MAGLFSYLAAGAAEGVGTSMVEQAKAKREAALDALRTEREMAFRRGEREASQAFSQSERIADQSFSASENAKTREAAGDVVRLEDGSSAVRSGSTVKPLMGADGKPAKIAATSDKDDPADVRTAEWLIEKGVAKDYDDAWKRVRSAKDNPNARSKLVLDTYKTLKEDIGDRRSDDEKRAAAKQLVDELITEDDGEAAPTADPAAPDAGKPPKIERPKGMSDEDIISQAQEALKNGKDKAAIRSRLVQLGIDPAKAGI